ncbi:MAG TPA: ribosome maturation factor RimM [Burkholderiales bacterium]|nr:ribosome maturation factor RimM [Burkholderiales bacterium]
MGRVSAPFGVAGWMRVQPYTAAVEGLLSYRTWWLGSGEQWKAYQVEQAHARGRALVAKLEGCEDRDSAARFRGNEVAVPRHLLPRTAANEWYWADLIGLKVISVGGEELGILSRILRTGANDVLVVQGVRERLIPFIEDVVQEVDVPAGVIRVDWSAEY